MTGITNPQTDLRPRLDRVYSLLAEEITIARDNNDPALTIWEETDELLQDLMSVLGWRVTSEHLKTRFQITRCGTLQLKSDSLPSGQDSSVVDEKDGDFTADMAYGCLKTIVSIYVHNRGSVLHWIDYIFLRIVSMTYRSGFNHYENATVTRVQKARVPGIKVLQQPYIVSGFIDCSGLSTVKDVDKSLSERLEPEQRKLAVLQEYSVQFLYTSEPKGDFDQDLELKVPQAVLEMYSCAISLEKQVIRGILTSGHQWIFLVLEVKEDVDGGQYYQSEPFDLVDPATHQVSKDASIVLTDVIAYWVRRSHEQVGPDDKFSVMRDVEG